MYNKIMLSTYINKIHIYNYTTLKTKHISTLSV